jgi:hypothetical protein
VSDNEVLMEEVTKKEPQPSPTLLISDVQTMKHEAPESSMNFIKVRTPTSINNGANGAGSGRILVKRLGSTTIRTVPAQHMKQAAKAQLVKMANGSYQTHPAYSPTLPRSLPPQAPQPKPMIPTLYRSQPDPRDDIIRQLQEQNREMKKMLLECRREAGQIQMKMRRWTVVINDVLGKVQRLQVPGAVKAFVQKPTVVAPKPMPPPPPVPAPPTPKTSGTVMKVTARKSTSMPPHPPPPTDVVFRSPAFPMKNFSHLKNFEGDLKNREFFDFISQKLMTIISKFKIEKPATLLAYVLQTLINPSLLACMIWDHQDCSLHDAAQRLALLNFRRFRDLYSRLVNNMSKILYGKNLDPAAIERFLRSKLYSDLKLRQHNAQVQHHQMAQRQAAASLELRKAMVQAEKQQQANISMQDDNDCDVEWIDDKVGESCELGNEILGDDNEDEKPPEEDEHKNDKMEHGDDGENVNNPDETLGEHDFHFLDC